MCRAGRQSCPSTIRMGSEMEADAHRRDQREGCGQRTEEISRTDVANAPKRD